MPKVVCTENGQKDEIFVCQHLVQGLEEGVAYGFW